MKVRGISVAKANSSMTNEKRPVICLSTIDWHFLFQRHQHLMLRLSEAGHPVYYINASYNAGYPSEKVAPGLSVCGNYEQIPWQARESGIYFVYSPAFFSIIPSGSGKFIIYDCVDDFPEFEPFEQQALSRSDLILCSSNALFQKHLGRHSQVMLLPNGVSLEHFQKLKRKLPHEISQIKASGQPIIGFAGAMCKDWVDIDLLYQLASLNPGWHVVIIGEIYGWDFTSAPSNLSYLGRKPYSLLPQYLAGFDVALIPFIDNQISRGTDPIKLYEYIAAGLPVVSRLLPCVENLHPPLVYTYNEAQECSGVIEQALWDQQLHSVNYQPARQEFAANNSWDMRVKGLLGRLGEMTWLDTARAGPAPKSDRGFITKDGLRHTMKIAKVVHEANRNNESL